MALYEMGVGRRAEAAAIGAKASGSQQRTISAIKFRTARSLSAPRPSTCAAKRNGMASLFLDHHPGLDTSPFHFEIDEPLRFARPL